MSKKSIKFYVIWAGRSTGIFESWEECKNLVSNFEGALYKSFESREEAEIALKNNPYKYFGKKNEPINSLSSNNKKLVNESLSVDAACTGNPGIMEYRGVHTKTKKIWFHQKHSLGTNNIGEFLAIVHGLAEIKKQNLKIPVYTDSQTAISWIKKKKCATKLPETDETKKLFEIIRRAEKWLEKENLKNYTLLKWDTSTWGEIPADFGRKR